MKRQERAMQEGIGTQNTTSKPKSTKETGKSKPRNVKGKTEEMGKTKAEEKKRDVNNEGEIAEFFKNAGEVEAMMAMRGEWPSCLLCATVEQLSWGSNWSPFWDMNFMGGASHACCYSDVSWDDNIWDLKDFKPN